MTYTSPRRQLGDRVQTLRLDGRDFEFVTNQRGGESAIYKSPDSFLRIGNPDKIHNDLEIHKKMENAGFPVAKLLAEGTVDTEKYFIEASLGEDHLGELFAREISERGTISEELFQTFISLTEKFALAQLSTQIELKPYDAFGVGIMLDELCNELPEYAQKLRARFALVEEHTATLPFVITHGDFNPNNQYKTGVIDLEDSFYAPFGYDLVSAIVHINFFPDSKEFEFYAKYRFSNEQIKEFAQKIETLSSNAGLPALSDFWDDFEFCRAVWLAADIPGTPLLQKYRFDSLITKFLQD